MKTLDLLTNNLRVAIRHTMFFSLLVLLIGLTFSSFTPPVLTQSLIPVETEQDSDEPLTDIELIDEIAQDLQINQLNERELRDLIQSLQTDLVQIERDILTLNGTKTTTSNSITRLEELKNDPNANTAQLDDEIASLQSELTIVEADLVKKESRKEADLATIDQATDRLNQITTANNSDSLDLRSQVIEVFTRYSFYFGLIFIYFMVLQVAYILAERFITSEIAQDVVKFIATFIVAVLTVITLLIAFVGNLTYLLTGLGVISAALVVALQDFVSSLFAFFWIKIKGIYKNRDVIDINTGDTGIVTGIVTNVGVFRTTLKELYGEGELNAERSSGRIVSVPNSVILKAPVINYTHDNRILWHVMNVTITFESDFEEAKKQLEHIVQKQFKFAVDHKDQFLDDAYNLEYIYHPKVFMSIAGDGPQFDIWFATRYGKYREVREEMSGEILKAFNAHGIDLAYGTTRIIPTMHQDNKNGTIAFHTPGIID